MYQILITKILTILKNVVYLEYSNVISKNNFKQLHRKFVMIFSGP
jgi:hypothetical protein